MIIPSSYCLFTSLYLLLVVVVKHGDSLSPPEMGRRDAIAKAAVATAAAVSVKPSDAKEASTSISAAGSNDSAVVKNEMPGVYHAVIPSDNPPPILSVPIKTASATTTSPTTLNIPRVGYSFYKTAADKAERCAALSLRSGVTHLDLASQYQSNAEIGKAIQTYVKNGRTKLALDEKPELIDLLDAAHRYQTTRMKTKTFGGMKTFGARRRREELFLSYKLSNEEQSTDLAKVRDAVSNAMETLGVDYLDMVSIHSPLTNSETRLATYRALIDLQQGGGARSTTTKSSSSPIIRSVGVCNYGIEPLKEIVEAGLPLPVVNQLELSPFNTHSDVVEFCGKNGIAVSCAAWSKLSGASGPKEQWDVLSRIAAKNGITKAQVMVKWSLQKGYICVPRSGSGSKIERVAIAENSYGGGFVLRNGKVASPSSDANENIMLTPEEMDILDGLNINYKAGQLGRTDGWRDTDVTGPGWDPTDIV